MLTDFGQFLCFSVSPIGGPLFWAQKGGAPKGCAPQKGGWPKISRFFFLFPPPFRLCLSGGRNFGGVLKRRYPEMCTLEFSGCRVRAPAARSGWAAGFFFFSRRNRRQVNSTTHNKWRKSHSTSCKEGTRPPPGAVLPRRDSGKLRAAVQAHKPLQRWSHAARKLG